MTDDQSAKIISQLATLSENMAGMRREFADQIAGVRRDIVRQDQTSAEEREDSHASRRELHEKVNGVVQGLATVQGDVKVTAMVAAQARDTSVEVKAAVEKAAPTIADVEQAKKIGSILIWFIGGGGLAILAAALAWGEAFKAAISHYLGIK
jgi:hypothetical protein